MNGPSLFDFQALAARIARATQTRVVPTETQRAAERRRVDALEALADERNVPRLEDVRVALAAPRRSPFVDAVEETLAWARPDPAARRRRAAVRVLLSEVGCGKTVALSHAVVTAPRVAQYVTAPEVARTYRAMHDNRAAWSSWTKVDLLAIDELGFDERPETIAELVLERYDGGGVTLLAGNLTREEVLARYFTGRFERPLTDRLTQQADRGLRAFVAPRGLVSLRSKGAA